MVTRCLPRIGKVMYILLHTMQTAEIAARPQLNTRMATVILFPYRRGITIILTVGIWKGKKSMTESGT